MAQDAGSGLTQYLPLYIVCSIISTIAVGLRLWVRGAITKSLAHDDWMLLLAQVANLIYYGIQISLCVEDRGLDDLIDENKANALFQKFLGIAVTYSVSVFWLKASMGYYFYKWARATWQKMLIIIPLGTFEAYSIAILGLLVFRCGYPVQGAEVLSRPDCRINLQALHSCTYAFSVTNALFNWAFAFTLVVMVIRAKGLDLGTRQAIWVLVGLAMLGSLVSIARLAFIGLASLGIAARQDALGLNLVSAAEMAIGTVAISMAPMKPVLDSLRDYVRRLRHIGSRDTARDKGDDGGAMDQAASGERDRRAGAFPGVGIFPELSMLSRDDEESTLTILSKTLSSARPGAKVPNGGNTSKVQGRQHEELRKGLVSINEVSAEDS